MNKSVVQLFARKALVSAIASVSVAGVVGFSSSAYAQEITAVVRGIVTDAAGNPVDNAEIVVISQATGATRTVPTDARGFYYVRNLPAGVTYNVSVAAPGLMGASTEGLELAVGQIAVRNFELSEVEEVVVLGHARRHRPHRHWSGGGFRSADPAGFSGGKPQHQRHHPAGSAGLRRPVPGGYRFHPVQWRKPALQQSHG